MRHRGGADEGRRRDDLRDPFVLSLLRARRRLRRRRRPSTPPATPGRSRGPTAPTRRRPQRPRLRPTHLDHAGDPRRPPAMTAASRRPPPERPEQSDVGGAQQDAQDAAQIPTRRATSDRRTILLILPRSPPGRSASGSSCWARSRASRATSRVRSTSSSRRSPARRTVDRRRPGGAGTPSRATTPSSSQLGAAAPADDDQATLVYDMSKLGEKNGVRFRSFQVDAEGRRSAVLRPSTPPVTHGGDRARRPTGRTPAPRLRPRHPSPCCPSAQPSEPPGCR